MEIFDQLRGVLGIAVLLTLAWGLSENRARAPGWRWIAGALALQAGLALLIVRVPFVWDVVTLANEGVAAIERATLDGSAYMFGYLGGADLPFELKEGATGDADALIAHARSQLAGFKTPKMVVFQELPKTSTGKIQKFELREQAKSL